MALIFGIFPEGIPLGQEVLGHSSSKTTEIYTHVSQKTLEKIINPLDQAVQQPKAR